MTTDKQKLGDFGENLIRKKFDCPKCKRPKTLKKLPPNFKCADLICDFCGYLAQVKTKTVNLRTHDLQITYSSPFKILRLSNVQCK